MILSLAEPSRPPRTYGLISLVAGLALLGAVGCGSNARNEFAPPPPPEVTVAPPVTKSVTRHKQMTGTTSPFQRVEIRARVKGFLEEILYDPGDKIEEGKLLFRIDDADLQAVLAARRAELHIREAELALAEGTVQRYERALEKDAISELQVVEARAQRDVAKAAVETAKAAVTQAELDVSYTKIHAPIGGRIEKSRVDVGALVGATDATLLATIVNDDRIYADFTVSERFILERQAEMAAQGIDRNERKNFPVEMGFVNDDGFPYVGQFDHADTEIDATSGTIAASAIFENEDEMLFTGAYVRLRTPLDTIEDALLIPEHVIGSDQSGKYVLVVNGEDVVESRPIRVGELFEGNLRLVEQGLSADDRIVVNGLQRARPGAKVTPRTAGS